MSLFVCVSVHITQMSKLYWNFSKNYCCFITSRIRLYRRESITHVYGTWLVKNGECISLKLSFKTNTNILLLLYIHIYFIIYFNEINHNHRYKFILTWQWQRNVMTILSMLNLWVSLKIIKHIFKNIFIIYTFVIISILNNTFLNIIPVYVWVDA